MSTHKNISQEIQYNIKTYLDVEQTAENILHAKQCIGFEYFTELDSIDDILGDIQNIMVTSSDYRLAITKMILYIKKAFYQKQVDFDSFPIYKLNISIDILDNLLGLDINNLESVFHEWCLSILQKCRYSL